LWLYFSTIFFLASFCYALLCFITRDAFRLARCVRFLQPAGSEATTVGRRCMAEFSQLKLKLMLKLPLMLRQMLLLPQATSVSAAVAAAALSHSRSLALSLGCCAHVACHKATNNLVVALQRLKPVMLRLEVCYNFYKAVSRFCILSSVDVATRLNCHSLNFDTNKISTKSPQIKRQKGVLLALSLSLFLALSRSLNL